MHLSRRSSLRLEVVFFIIRVTTNLAYLATYIHVRVFELHHSIRFPSSS